MNNSTDTLPQPLGWFESPHGVFRANAHLRVQFPPSSLEWQIGVHDEPTVRRLLAERDERIRVLTEALRVIERWGPFPDFGQTWPDGTPMSYFSAYGSNGERDYMRGIARAALEAAR